MFCTECGQKLKSDASFCHECGAKLSAETAQESDIHEPEATAKSWLHSFGAFLFIPIFAGIVVLLFWVNKDPETVNASANATQAGAGMSEEAMQQVHGTLTRLQERVEANPQDLVAIDSLAVMFAIAGSYDKARTYYDKHLAIEPDNKDVKIALALTNHNLQDNDRAIALLEEVLAADPGYAFALHYLAEIHAALHNHEEADKYWQEIITQHPGTEFAQTAKKRMEEESGEH